MLKIHGYLIAVSDRSGKDFAMTFGLETTQAYLYITAYLERKRKVPRDLLYIRGIATAALHSQVYGNHLKTTVPPNK